MQTLTNEAEIFSRAIDLSTSGLSPEAVQSLSRLEFAPEDHQEMLKLVAKAQMGTLTESERAALDKYELVNDLLGILRSRVRRCRQD